MHALPLSAEQYLFDSFSNFRGAGRGVLSDFRTATARWKDLGGIQPSIGIEHAFDAHHRIEIGLGEDEIHKFLLLETDAVLAAERSANVDTQLHDFFAHAENFVDLLGIAAIKKDEWMKISISGMKHICHTQPVPLRHSIDRGENLRQTGSWNDRVHRDHIGSEAAHCTERALSPEPKPGTLIVVFGDADLVGAIAAANLHDRVRCFLQTFAKSIDLDQQRSRGVHGVSGFVYRSLDSLYRLRIDEFHGGRHNTGTDHIGNCLAAFLD